MCVPEPTVIDAAGVALITRRWYQGPALELTLASQARVTLTKSHPVLTHARWKPARQVRAGDYVVVNRSDADARPACEQWELLALSRASSEVPISPRAYWGDQDRFLTHAIQTAPKWPLHGPHAAEEGTPPPVTPGTVSVVLAALSRPEAFGCSSWAAACRTVPGLAEQWPNGRPTSVGAGVPAATARRLGGALDALPEPDPDREALSRALLGLPGTLALARVEAVSQRSLSGWVHSTATTTGAYAAGGVVVGG